MTICMTLEIMSKSLNEWKKEPLVNCRSGHNESPSVIETGAMRSQKEPKPGGMFTDDLTKKY